MKVYKSFIRPPLDYGDVVTIELLTNVHQSLESQYRASVVITEAIRGTLSEKLFQELALGTLKSEQLAEKMMPVL